MTDLSIPVERSCKTPWFSIQLNLKAVMEEEWSSRLRRWTKSRDASNRWMRRSRDAEAKYELPATEKGDVVDELGKSRASWDYLRQ